jgi:hypothetical protein
MGAVVHKPQQTLPDSCQQSFPQWSVLPGTLQDQWMKRPSSNSDMRSVQARVRDKEQPTPTTSSKQKPGHARGQKRGLGGAGGGGQDDNPEDDESKQRHAQEASHAPATTPVSMRSEVADQVLALYALTGEEEADLETPRHAFTQSWGKMTHDERLLVDAGLAAAELKLIGTLPIDATMSTNVLDALSWWQNNGALPTQSKKNTQQNTIANNWQRIQRGKPRKGTMTEQEKRLVQIALHIARPKASMEAQMREHIANSDMAFGDKTTDLVQALLKEFGASALNTLQQHLHGATKQQWLAYATKITARRSVKGRIDADRLALLGKSSADLTQAEIHALKSSPSAVLPRGKALLDAMKSSNALLQAVLPDNQAQQLEVSQYLGESCLEVLSALQKALGASTQNALQQHLRGATPQQWLAYATKITARRWVKGRIDADRLALLGKSSFDLTQTEIHAVKSAGAAILPAGQALLQDFLPTPPTPDPEMSKYLGKSCFEVLLALQKTLGPEWKPALQKHLKQATREQWAEYATKVNARNRKTHTDADQLALLDTAPESIRGHAASEVDKSEPVLPQGQCFKEVVQELMKKQRRLSNDRPERDRLKEERRRKQEKEEAADRASISKPLPGKHHCALPDAMRVLYGASCEATDRLDAFFTRSQEADAWLRSHTFSDCDFCQEGWFGTTEPPPCKLMAESKYSAYNKMNFILADRRLEDQKICQTCEEEANEAKDGLPKRLTQHNDMSIGGTHAALDALTFFEEELLSPVQPVVRIFTLYQTGQAELRGHVANWAQAGPQWVREIPAKAGDSKILLVRRFPKDMLWYMLQNIFLTCEKTV